MMKQRKYKRDDCLARTRTRWNLRRAAWSLVAGTLLSLPAGQGWALVVSDNFTGTSASNTWVRVGGACLTAGDGSGSIPQCGSKDPNNNNQLGGYSGSMPDASGQGALRLTNSSNNQSGAIIYNNTFDATSGISATWTTYTYDGDSGGSARDGADGMSFFLLDATNGIPAVPGAFGGSLGYSCSNVNSPYDGIVGGYLGLGMDEYGNFTNGGSSHDNTATGPGYYPQSISLRGAGSVSAAWLKANYPSYYPNPQPADVQAVCKAGRYQIGSSSYSSKVYNWITIPGLSSGAHGVYTLPSSQPIAAESASRRTSAVPISYKLQITPTNLLSLWYSYNNGAYVQVIKGYDISSNSISGPLPSRVTFGFAGSTGGSRNIHEITCFQAAPQTSSASSAGLNEQQSAQVQTGTQAYLAYYHWDNWWGNLTSVPVVINSSTGALSLSTTADWDASCVLTGGTCSATGSSNTAQDSSSRVVLSWNGSQGIPFQWASLSASQQSALNASDNYGQDRLAFLRGDRSKEITSSGSGQFRARTGVLGDIVNSSPTWVGPPQKSFQASWSDLINASATNAENASDATAYPTFKSNNATRANIVYTGANDGMLHGFRSGAYDSNGNYSTSSTPNDGQEQLAYIPNAVLSNVYQYSNASYAHQYYVDAAPGSGDLFYNKAWHTWLVGGLGSGGKAIYALDVTNPANFSESQASSLVMGEWSDSTISCVGNSSCGNDLGNTFGTPVIARFHNGSWGAVFGNGYNSSSGVGAIYIMLVNPTSGAITFYELSTGYGPSQDPTNNSTKNGIYYTAVADLDGDNIADYIYAGDLFGNVWRFDVTNSDPTKWSASTYAGTSASPLFSAPSSLSYLRPITTKPLLAKVLANSTSPRQMVYFGTGQKTPFTSTAADGYAASGQSFYGVWDWNMSGWDGKGSIQLATPTTNPTVALTDSNLQAQTRTGTSTSTSSTVYGYAYLSSNAVCWAGSSACSGSNTQYGWKFSFPNSLEQLVYSPQLVSGVLLFNSTIPASNTPSSCSSGQASGWTYAMDPNTGGAFSQSVFTNDQGTFTGISGNVVSGIQLNAVGSFQTVVNNASTYLIYQNVNGQTNGNGGGNITGLNAPSGSRHARLTWIELR